MMEPDAAPAGGRRTLLPSTRAAPGAPPGGQYEPPARSWLTGVTPRGLPQAPDASWLLTRGRGRQEEGGKLRARKRKARPGAAGSAYDCGRSGGRRPQMSPDRQHTCLGGPPGGASASSQGDADPDGLRQRPLARHPLASGGKKKEDGVPGAAKKQGGGALACPP